MKFFTCPLLLLAAFAIPLSLAGCDSGGSSSTAPSHDEEGHDHKGHDHGAEDHKGHDHEHGETGPNGGHLIELGRNHKYHAELVENDAAGTVSIYILDTHMKELAIGEASIILSLTSDGETISYEMGAMGEGETHSQFESADKALFQTLEKHGEVTGKLRVTIDGVPYTGSIEHHEHDHAQE